MAPHDSRIASKCARQSSIQRPAQVEGSEDVLCVARKAARRSRVSKIVRHKKLLVKAQTSAKHNPIDVNNNSLDVEYGMNEVDHLFASRSDGLTYPVTVIQTSASIFHGSRDSDRCQEPSMVQPSSTHTNSCSSSRTSSPFRTLANCENSSHEATREQGICSGQGRLPSTRHNSVLKAGITVTAAVAENCRPESRNSSTERCAREVRDKGSTLRIGANDQPSSRKSARQRVALQKPYENLSNVQLQRRLLANARERSRVHALSSAFHCLRRVIPSYSPEQKLSKLTILRVAIHYINALDCLVNCDGSYEAKINYADSVEECTAVLRTEYGRSRSKSAE